jgi:competence protein ComEC
MPFIDTAKQIPFFRLLIPFVLGIVLALNASIWFNHFQLSIFLLLLLGATVGSYFISSKWNLRWLFGFFVCSILFLSGIIITLGIQNESQIKVGTETSAVVMLLEPSEVRTTSTRVLAKVTMQKDNSIWQQSSEKVILYFSSTDSLAKTLKYGTSIVLTANFTAPPDPLNPYQFNHKEYLRKKQIHRTAFVSNQNWHIINNNDNSILAEAHTFRDKLFTLYKSVGIKDENLAVLSALTTGYKSMLDQETRRVFSASGAMHILAVSGLHVGILFATLSAFLFFLSNTKKGKIVKSIILISFLWLFAIFTGLSPSVIRASLMFSLVIAGTTFSRKTNIYNTLSASAFIILAINPLLITEVGFQLSYLALLSIVYFYPHFYGLLYVKNKWLDKVWALVCVSLAAQVGTFVLGLYYFNQFPNYFLLTNLYAIPLASLILYLSILLIAVSPIPILASAVGWFLNQVLSVLIYLIQLTEALPYSTLNAISISQTQAIMLVGAILMIAVFLAYRKSIYIYMTLICLLAFTIEMSIMRTQQLNNNELIVFAHRNSTAIGFRNGNKFSLVHSDTTSKNPHSNFAMSIEGYMNKLGIKNIYETLELSNSDKKVDLKNISATQNNFGNWIEYHNKIIFIPSKNDFMLHTTNFPINVDILILSNQTNANINDILSLIKPATVIIDQTVPTWKQVQLAKQLSSLNIDYYDIRSKGAYRISL